MMSVISTKVFIELLPFRVEMKKAARKNTYCITHTKKSTNLKQINFPRQSLKRFTFRVKSSDSIFFLLGLSPIVN